MLLHTAEKATELIKLTSEGGEGSRTVSGARAI